MPEEPATDPPAEPTSARSRPWRVTYAGGRCLSTFRYREHALERAREVIVSGRLRTVWVRKRGETDAIEITRKRNEPPRKVDEGPVNGLAGTAT